MVAKDISFAGSRNAQTTLRRDRLVATLTTTSASASSPAPDLVVEPELVIGARDVLLRAHVTYDDAALRTSLNGCASSISVNAELSGGPQIAGASSVGGTLATAANYSSVDVPIALDREGIFAGVLRVVFSCGVAKREETVRVFVRRSEAAYELVSYDEYAAQFKAMADAARAAVGPQPGQRDGEQLLPANLQGLRCGDGLSCRSRAHRRGEEQQ